MAAHADLSWTKECTKNTPLRRALKNANVVSNKKRQIKKSHSGCADYAASSAEDTEAETNAEPLLDAPSNSSSDIDTTTTDEPISVSRESL